MKKTRQLQQQRGEDEEVKNAPHSFVIPRGKVGKNVMALVNNMRKVMSPFTAEHLKVKICSHALVLYLIEFIFNLKFCSIHSMPFKIVGSSSQCDERFCSNVWSFGRLTHDNVYKVRYVSQPSGMQVT